MKRVEMGLLDRAGRVPHLGAQGGLYAVVLVGGVHKPIVGEGAANSHMPEALPHPQDGRQRCSLRTEPHFPAAGRQLRHHSSG